MSIPGFTAELTLAPSSGTYRTRPALTASAATAVLAVRLGAPDITLAALTPVSCSEGDPIRVNVPYVPYTYCYWGDGVRRVNLTQVWSVERGATNVTVLWRRPGGEWLQTTMSLGLDTLYVNGGDVDTLSIP